MQHEVPKITIDCRQMTKPERLMLAKLLKRISMILARKGQPLTFQKK